MKSEPKQIIVMRKDLNMRRGKQISQGCHASMAAIMGYAIHDPHNITIPKSNAVCLGKDPHNVTCVREWLEGRFTKICVSVDSEEQLLAVYNQAKQQGIICSLITDAGLTEFNGVPTKTCCAIGPDYPERIDPITGHLKLL